MGSLNGVLSTVSAWRDGLEVVDLTYDPAIIDYEDIVQAASEFKCASRVFTYDADQQDVASKLVGSRAVPVNARQRPRVAKDSDQKYYLRHTDLRHLPLTEIQATKINASLKMRNIKPTALLSPRQRDLYARMQAAAKRDASFKSKLSRFVRPTDADELLDYSAKLESALAKVEQTAKR